MLKLHITLEHSYVTDWILPKYAKSVVYFFVILNDKITTKFVFGYWVEMNNIKTTNFKLICYKAKFNLQTYVNIRVVCSCSFII